MKKFNVNKPAGIEPSDKTFESYSFYSVRRKGELTPCSVMGVFDLASPDLVNFLKRNPEWEPCKITVSKA